MALAVEGKIDWLQADHLRTETRRRFHAKRTAQGYHTVKEDDLVCMERLPRKDLKDADLIHKAECIRLTTVLPISPKQATRLLNDYEVRKSWEETLTKESRSDVVLLQHDNETLQVIRTLSTPALGGLISPREFVDLALTEERDDGSILHVAQSIEHPDFAHTKGFVRGTNFPCGMLYEPVAGGGDESDVVHTKLTYVIHSDVGGWLPASLVFKGTTTTMWNILQNLHRHIAQSNQS